MRQVFTSVRLENVEQVEKMLNDAGIATKVNQGRSWKGVSRREFSYSDKNHDPGQQPSLWVIKPEDFKQAREILHDAGLLEATRDASYLPEHLQFDASRKADPLTKVSRLRMALLFIVALVAAGLILRSALG
ncbi:MAG: pathogenicity-like protein [Lysobacteraceae bacterium]|nr:MAG: pathogenicity-like protein [Xanthomonadaceae bacterium]